MSSPYKDLKCLALRLIVEKQRSWLQLLGGIVLISVCVKQQEKGLCLIKDIQCKHGPEWTQKSRTIFDAICNAREGSQFLPSDVSWVLGFVQSISLSPTVWRTLTRSSGNHNTCLIEHLEANIVNCSKPIKKCVSYLSLSVITTAAHTVLSLDLNRGCSRDNPPNPI